jgi:hypothetical protein
MKYIMYKVTMANGEEKPCPIIFPDFMVHKNVKEEMKRVFEANEVVKSEVVSAGFVLIPEAICRGNSESLRKEYRKEDEIIIEMLSCTQRN